MCVYGVAMDSYYAPHTFRTGPPFYLTFGSFQSKKGTERTRKILQPTSRTDPTDLPDKYMSLDFQPWTKNTLTFVLSAEGGDKRYWEGSVHLFVVIITVPISVIFRIY